MDRQMGRLMDGQMGDEIDKRMKGQLLMEKQINGRRYSWTGCVDRHARNRLMDRRMDGRIPQLQTVGDWEETSPGMFSRNSQRVFNVK